jgi:hypothetical protein
VQTTNAVTVIVPPEVKVALLLASASQPDGETPEGKNGCVSVISTLPASVPKLVTIWAPPPVATFGAFGQTTVMCTGPLAPDDEALYT